MLVIEESHKADHTKRRDSPCDELFLGGDWARKSDNTWFSITNRFNDVIPLAAEFEDQMTKLEREYLSDGEYLSVHHPKTADGRDDAPDCTALALFAVSTGMIGDILFS